MQDAERIMNRGPRVARCEPGPGTINSRHANEKGIALVMVLVLSMILLAIMAGLIYMVTSGTQMSGIQKRYKTALEAGTGGANITFQFIAQRGETAATSSLRTDFVSQNPIDPDTTTLAACTGTDMFGATITGWAAKLLTRTSTWSAGCNRALTITPPASGDNTSYDMRFDLGAYRVYTKIVDTVEGNTGADLGLIKEQVVGQNEAQGITIPFLYTIELDAENSSQPVGNRERAKLSLFYEY